jgi:hypothetical protein
MFALKCLRVSKASFFLCLVSLGGIPIAASQSVFHKTLPKKELEQYDNAPVFVGKLGASPAMVSQHGAYTSYQVNVDSNGQNITGDAANEPSICVDPTNLSRMAIGWRQFDSVLSNFRQAGYGYTTNGGTSWTFPGKLENNVFRSDPVLVGDASGNFFYLSLLQTFFDDIWRSITGGQSWTRIGPATGGDKQWFTIDNTSSSGHGFQYQSWSTAGNNYGGRQFSRSTNGGVTWMNPIFIPNSPIWGTLDVDTNGNLFIGGVNADTNQIWCIRSSSAKNSAVTPTFDQATAVNLGGDIVASDSINPEGLAGQIYVAVDRSGTSTNNNVYMLASVQPTGFFTGTDVMFVRSTDGGRTFSSPIRVNDDPVNHNKWHWLAALSVAPNGRLDVVWLDTRNATNNTDSQLFYSFSVDGGNTWSPNIAVSEPFSPFVGYPNQNKMGDYISIISDSAGGNVAYCATFNGEEDIYYVRVAPPPPQLLNISSRVDVLTGDQVAIAGFIINGTDPKTVVVRGIGPSLSGAGVQGTLPDPTLELHDGSRAMIASNDNWKTKPDGTSQQAAIEATGLAPNNDLESAIAITLNPGQYTAILAGKNGDTGIGLVEVYDLSRAANSKLSNISTRGFVGTNDNVMIGGLIIGKGNVGATGRVLVRAIGPSLSNAGVQGALQDPTLELHDGNGTTIDSNDNWKTRLDGSSQQAAIQATGLAPSNDLESALLETLVPGNYTAIVRGKNSTTGVGLVEIYNLQ